MECLCFKLEFGHLIPEFERQNKGKTDKQQRKRWRQKKKKGETEMVKSVKILIVTGGKLIRPTVFQFCVEMSRHIDSRQNDKSKLQEIKETIFYKNRPPNNSKPENSRLIHLF